MYISKFKIIIWCIEVTLWVWSQWHPQIHLLHSIKSSILCYGEERPVFYCSVSYGEERPVFYCSVSYGEEWPVSYCSVSYGEEWSVSCSVSYGEEWSVSYCSVSRQANKLCQWKSMLTHQGWFITYIYRLPLLVSQIEGFVICIVHIVHLICYTNIIIIPMTANCHITFPSEKSQPETRPGKYMQGFTQSWTFGGPWDSTLIMRGVPSLKMGVPSFHI